MVRHKFVCHTCGEKAGVVQLITGPDGPELMVSSFVCRSGATIDPGEREKFERAVSAGDARTLHLVDDELVPFFCPDCGVCYCGEHWKHRQVIEEDGWYDCTRGICPAGHKRRMAD